jgi:GNAT superfamily N-acetyltransferase
MALDTPALLERGYAVLRELRTELTLTEYAALYSEAHKRDGFVLIGAFEDDALVGVMGVRILFDFAHGKHLYVDDLVVTEAKRGSGVGAALLNKAEQIAKEKGCASLRLCTGIANDAAKKFYAREGWTLRSVAFKKRLGR